MFRALNRVGYQGPLSIEWEDSGMDRDWGAPDALAFVRRTDFAPSSVAFDAAFSREVPNVPPFGGSQGELEGGSVRTMRPLLPPATAAARDPLYGRAAGARG